MWGGSDWRAPGIVTVLHEVVIPLQLHAPAQQTRAGSCMNAYPEVNLV